MTLQSRLSPQLSKQAQKGTKVKQLGNSKTELLLTAVPASKACYLPLHHAFVMMMLDQKFTLNLFLVQSNSYAVLFFVFCGH